ncbi:AlpA family phage regulatory protein [Dechloromonas sp. ZS-1]|uniref:helix-turn-helix transcriptional regulator n=1 Tax=Dechloromonas sp. ZS-1 TaxID=3138067 RepID=UPI0031FD8B75
MKKNLLDVSGSSLLPTRIVRIRELEYLIGRKRSTIYLLMNRKSRYFDPSFPKRIRLSSSMNGGIGWFEHEIIGWLHGKAAERDNSISG